MPVSPQIGRTGIFAGICAAGQNGSCGLLKTAGPDAEDGNQAALDSNENLFYNQLRQWPAPSQCATCRFNLWSFHVS